MTPRKNLNAVDNVTLNPLGPKGRRFRLDAHNDTLMKLSAPGIDSCTSYFDNPSLLGLEVSWPALQRGHVNAAFYAAFSPGQGTPEENHQRLLSAFKAMATIEAEALRRDLPLEKYWGGPLQHANQRPFRHLMVQTIEGAYAFTEANALHLVDQYADLGVMAIAPVWNHPSIFGGGTATQDDLTDLGRLILEKFHQRHILLDVSHMNEPTFWSSLKIAQGPVIASHSGSAALRSHVRNLTDEQIKGLAAKGGLINVVFHRDFITLSKEATIHHVIEHMLHMRGLVGSGHVGIGSDFDGCETPEGLENIGRLEALDYLLKKHGVPVAERNAMLGGNLCQLLSESAAARSKAHSLHPQDGIEVSITERHHAITKACTHYELHIRLKEISIPELWIDGLSHPLTPVDAAHWTIALDADVYKGHRLVSILIGPHPQERKTLLISL